MTTSAAPLISIIVPSYNQAEFVPDCLESIFSQIGASFEVILIDGGSDNATLAQIEPYRARLAHFVCEKDRGQSHAINKGLKIARGRLVTWLNTDDFYLPGALIAAAAAYDLSPTAPFYLGRGFRTDRNGRARIAFYPDLFTYCREALIWGLNFILQPATFINHQVWQAVGPGLDESLHFAMDSDLWLRLAKQGDPQSFAHEVACSREYADNKTSRGGWPRIAEIQRVAQRHSGAPLTPGVLAEICRQLLESSDQPEVAEHFPPALRPAILELWAAAGGGLRKVANRDDGLPVKLWVPE